MFQFEVEEEEPVIWRRNAHDYRTKAEITFFYGTLKVEEFLDWKIKVDQLFDVIDIPKEKQVKLVAFHLKSVAAVWWDKLVRQRQRQRKRPVQSWKKMKQLMVERFLLEDHE